MALGVDITFFFLEQQGFEYNSKVRPKAATALDWRTQLAGERLYARLFLDERTRGGSKGGCRHSFTGVRQQHI